MRNSEKYPEAWKWFIELARNVNGTYEIPHPVNKEIIIKTNDPGILFMKFKDEFYKEDFNSPSLRGKIQYVVNHF